MELEEITIENVHQRRRIGLALTALGGAVDVYTYLRFGSFAAAQTGNLILMLIDISNHAYTSALGKFSSTFLFFIGMIGTRRIVSRMDALHHPQYRRFLLYGEAVVFAILALLGDQVLRLPVIMILAFCAAIQWIAFDKIRGRSYTNLFTTGNLKSLALSLNAWLITPDQAHREDVLHYLAVITSFLAGAAFSVILYRLQGIRSVVWISLGYFCVAMMLSMMHRQINRKG